MEFDPDFKELEEIFWGQNFQLKLNFLKSTHPQELKAIVFLLQSLGQEIRGQLDGFAGKFFFGYLKAE